MGASDPISMYRLIERVREVKTWAASCGFRGEAITSIHTIRAMSFIYDHYIISNEKGKRFYSKWPDISIYIVQKFLF